MKTFVCSRGREPAIHEFRYIVDLITLEYDGARVHGRALRVALQHEFGDNAKVRTATTYTIEKVGIFIVTGSKDRPISDNNSGLGKKWRKSKVRSAPL